MKVFVSHSTADRWVARRIVEDLEKMGIEVFLDEKSIETGESIDDSITAHLRDSDELLMLLSPQAIKSHWVMIEIGGARALGIRLVPILLNLGANDLPYPLSKGLARDINDIERYFEELRGRAAKPAGSTTATKRPSKKAPLKKAPRRIVARPLQPGDTVRIRENLSDLSDPDGLGINEEMESLAGKVTRIIELDDEGIATFRLDIDGGRWYWSPVWLERMSTALSSDL